VVFVEEFTSSATWTCPTGVHFVAAEMWGGAGAGGGAAAANRGGGGGQGGCYVFSGMIPVTAGNSYAVTVSTTTPGSVGNNGPNGGNTRFVGDGDIQAFAAGGGGGKLDGTAGSGSESSCIGDLIYAGGTGAAGSTTEGGSGGGCAGSQGVGGEASGIAVGVGVAINPQRGNNTGNGAAGRTVAGAGSSSAFIGGAGAGALNTTAANKAGGTGGLGYLRLLYASGGSGGGLPVIGSAIVRAA